MAASLTASRRIKEKLGDRIVNIVIVFILFCVLVVTLYPFLHVISVSISNPTEVLENRVTFYPRGFFFKCYERVMQDRFFLRSYLNTLIYTTLGVLINIFMTVTMAYPLSRTKFMGKSIFLPLIVFTMIFTTGIIPHYLLVMQLGMIDKIWAIILPPAVNTFNLMILRTSFAAMPVELEESAKIDGANDFQVLMRVCLPVSKAILMTIGLFYTVEHWNRFMAPFLYLNTREKYPLQVVLRGMLISGEMAEYVDFDQLLVTTMVKYTTIVVSILPVLFIYPFIQRYFTKGVLLGSLKG
ncbi:MAG: carbohydrate ABC transporter permease [Bacteroidota bacterium]